MLAIATFAKFTKLSSCKLAFLLYDSYVTQIIIGVAQLIRPRPDAYTSTGYICPALNDFRVSFTVHGRYSGDQGLFFFIIIIIISKTHQG